MASSSGRKSGSSGRSGPRKRVVIGAAETVRVRYDKNEPQVEAERRRTPRAGSKDAGRVRPGETARTSSHAKRVSSAKRIERERRQRAARVRQGALLGAVVFGLALLVWGFIALYNSSVLPVRSIEVTGTTRLTESDVVKLAAIPSGSTLVRLDTKSVQQRIGASPWVAEVSVGKRFPGSIRIEIQERTAVAIVDAGGTDLWLVSSDGRWLEQMSARDEGLLVIRDLEGVTPVQGGVVRAPELRNALRIVAGISPALKKLTRAVSAPTIDKTALLTVDDVEVFIGSADELAEKDRIVREILSSKKNEVVYINVRVVESPIWRGLE